MLNKIIGIVIIVFNGVWAYQTVRLFIEYNSESTPHLLGNSKVTLAFFLVFALVGMSIGIGIFVGKLLPRRWAIIAFAMVMLSVVFQQLF